MNILHASVTKAKVVKKREIRSLVSRFPVNAPHERGRSGHRGLSEHRSRAQRARLMPRRQRQRRRGGGSRRGLFFSKGSVSFFAIGACNLPKTPPGPSLGSPVEVPPPRKLAACRIFVSSILPPFVPVILHRLPRNSRHKNYPAIIGTVGGGGTTHGAGGILITKVFRDTLESPRDDGGGVQRLLPPTESAATDQVC